LNSDHTVSTRYVTVGAVSLDISQAQKAFLLVAKKLENLGGPIDILIGMDHMDEALREHKRGSGLGLYKSVFKTGYVVHTNIMGMS
jgi:hypothetical protein